MAPGSTRVVVADASVLFNLMHTKHLAMLGRLPGFDFVVPDEVVAEVRRPEQKAMLEAGLEAGHLASVRMDALSELSAYANLRERFDPGESACLALAASRGWLVACDERRAFVREADARLGPDHVINTPGLYVLFIRAGLLTVGEADAAKAILERNRFKMKFGSFAELVD